MAGIDGRETQAGVNCTRPDDETELVGDGNGEASIGTGHRPPGLCVSRIRSLGAGAGDEPGPDEAGGDGAGLEDEG